MTSEQAAALRAPFKPEQIGKLPKPTKRDNPKGSCKECGGYHGLPAVHLDYVGHAATTDRLIQVDPSWSWEPMAFGPNGEPLMTNGGMWIWLTVCGVRRPGFGDGATPKEVIGDAIRNAAMRFGVALDLWAKEDLKASGDEPTAGKNSRVAERPVSQAPDSDTGEPASSPETSPVEASFKQKGEITVMLGDLSKLRKKPVKDITAALVADYGPLEKLSAKKADELYAKMLRWKENLEAEAAA